jgi:hypothetical protein
MREARLEPYAPRSAGWDFISNSEIEPGWKAGAAENSLEVGTSPWRGQRGFGFGSTRRDAMSSDGRTEGSVELIAAIFRLAIADYLGQSYSHDACAPIRRTSCSFRPDAEAFLTGPWARYLADQVGLEGSAVWRHVRYLDGERNSAPPIAKSA